MKMVYFFFIKKEMMKNLKNNLITNYFKKNYTQSSLNSIKIDSSNDDYIINLENNLVFGYNEKTGNWHCVECGENMGNNPRQLCGKNICRNF